MGQRRRPTTTTTTTTTTHEHEHGHRPADVITALLDAADLPDARARRRPIACSARWPRSRARCTASTRTTSSSTRSARSTRSSTSSACAPRSTSLGVDRIVASPIAVGHGTIRAAHGDLPNPAPAVARLLAQRGVPIVGVDTTMELATPTGVAVLVALAERVRGAAGDDGRARSATAPAPPTRPADPTSCRCVVGDRRRRQPSRRGPGGRPCQLEVNVDDVTGEVLAHTIAALLAGGRPRRLGHADRDEEGPAGAHRRRARATRPTSSALAAVLLAETGSLGDPRGDGRALAAATRASVASTSTVSRSGSRSPAAGSRSSTTTPRRGRAPRASAARRPAAGRNTRCGATSTRNRFRRSARARGTAGGFDPGQSSRVAPPGRHRAAARRQLHGRRRRPGRARRAPTASASRRCCG